MKDIVFEICAAMLRNSPARSFKRLNPSLRSTLENCITADLPFRPDTFQKIYNELRGTWWFGAGAGSHVGEHFYSTACGCNHASAQRSFEQFAERPGCLWEEDAKNPERLHVGSSFTWQGQWVKVTSMRADSLVACIYKRDRNRVEGLRAGATIGYNPEHLITSAKRAGSAMVLRVVKLKEEGGESEVARRFTIPYSEISGFRKTIKARLKAILGKIASCDPQKDAVNLTKEINAAHFRHFELEDIRAAFQSRKDWVINQARLQAWIAGEGEAWLDVKSLMVRVRGDRVECSNGNGVSKSAAIAVLPVLLEHRKTSLALNIPLDGYYINRVGGEGVSIGCTLVPWSEVERIAPQLQAV